MIKTRTYNSTSAYQELSQFVIYYHYNRKACDMSIDSNSSVSDQSDYDYEDYIKQIDMNLAGKVGQSIFCEQSDTNIIEENDNTSLDIFRQRMLNDKIKFLKERESIVRNILSKEKDMIEYFYPIIMKKGHLSYKNTNRYLKKFENKAKELAF